MESEITIKEIQCGLKLSVEETMKLKMYISSTLQLNSYLENILDKDTIIFIQEFDNFLTNMINGIS